MHLNITGTININGYKWQQKWNYKFSFVGHEETYFTFVAYTRRILSAVNVSMI